MLVGIRIYVGAWGSRIAAMIRCDRGQAGRQAGTAGSIIGQLLVLLYVVELPSRMAVPLQAA